ncbi:hypothetical protein CPB83DRAFT_892575 [Crepidotus variabilis]|uniref:F-box domain-containing protein n=1 Tax=Crepidotus variabilis TaxID=179855 RepID=A0A9P6JSK1_9AGAR|nr:hypothetical protein CPB83DRAFT_892575 [Crepidotus variabilis]
MEIKHPSTKGQSSNSKSSSFENKRRRTEHDNSSATKPLQPKRFVAGAKGRLKILTELPVDVLLEILGHLEPSDLLHLSRANKSLHTLLTSNNTAYLWNQAFENIPQEYRPPDGVPSGVDARLYTNFLYGDSCQICGSSPSTFVHYLMRIKYCSKCAMPRTWPASSFDDETPYCIVHSNTINIHGKKSFHYWGVVFSLEHDRHRREISEARSDGTLEALLIKKGVELRLAKAKNAKFLSWAKSYALYPRKQSKDRLQQRQKQLLWRLEGEGYADVISLIQINILPTAKVSRELGNEEWRYIRADVLDTAQGLRELERENQIQAHLRVVLDELQKLLDALELDHSSILPTASIVASNAPVSDFILDVPEGQIITQQDLEPLRKDCLKKTTSWRNDIDNYLIDLLPLPRPAESNVSDLNLATTFFKCHFCTEPITYPRVLVHKCLRTRNDSGSARDKVVETEELTRKVNDVDGEDDPQRQSDTYREPRPHRTISIRSVFSKMHEFYPTGLYPGRKSVVFDEESHRFAKSIILACRKDPRTVTLKEMQASDILHDIESHFEEDNHASHWLLVTSEEALLRVKSLESQSKKKSRSLEYICTICHTALHSSSLVKHLLDSHTIEPDITDEHWWSGRFVANLDASFKRAPFPVKL